MNDLNIGAANAFQVDELSTGLNYTVDESVSKSDALTFESELNKVNTNSPDTSFSDHIIEKFSSISEDIGIKKDKFEHQLKKAAETGDPIDIIAATRAMADYQLQVQVTTKVASKTNSAIEKISNLQ